MRRTGRRPCCKRTRTASASGSHGPKTPRTTPATVMRPQGSAGQRRACARLRHGRSQAHQVFTVAGIALGTEATLRALTDPARRPPELRRESLQEAGRPFAVALKRLSSKTGTSMFMSATPTWRANVARASRQTRATARDSAIKSQRQTGDPRVFGGIDDRRIMVVANGLPLRYGAQLAVAVPTNPYIAHAGGKRRPGKNVTKFAAPPRHLRQMAVADRSLGDPLVCSERGGLKNVCRTPKFVARKGFTWEMIARGVIE